MRRNQFWLLVPACCVLVSACEQPTDADLTSQVATLYRNGSIAQEMRLHFGSYDVQGESNDYNINNCRMTARLLNSNISAQWSAQGLPDVGFWCEPGPYREDGMPPQIFDSEYPTDVEGIAAP